MRTKLTIFFRFFVGNNEVVLTLIDNGANLYARNSMGKTVQDIAIKNGHARAFISWLI